MKNGNANRVGNELMDRETSRKRLSPKSEPRRLDSIPWTRPILESVVKYIPYTTLTKLLGLGSEMCSVVAITVAKAAMASVEESSLSGDPENDCATKMMIQRRSLTANLEGSSQTAYGNGARFPSLGWNDGMIISNACLLRVPNEIFFQFTVHAFDSFLSVPILDTVVMTVALLNREPEMLTSMSDDDAWAVACEDLREILRQNHSVGTLLVDLSFCGIDAATVDAIRARLYQRGMGCDGSLEEYLQQSASESRAAGVVLGWMATVSHYQPASLDRDCDDDALAYDMQTEMQELLS